MFETITPLIGALFAVVIVLYLSYRVSRWLASGATRMGSSRYMKTVDRIVLGPDRMLLIVSVGERYYMVGSTSNSINLLKELSPEEILEAKQTESDFEKEGAATGLKSFQSVLQTMLSKKINEKKQ